MEIQITIIFYTIQKRLVEIQRIMTVCIKSSFYLCFAFPFLPIFWSLLVLQSVSLALFREENEHLPRNSKTTSLFSGKTTTCFVSYNAYTYYYLCLYSSLRSLLSKKHFYDYRGLQVCGLSFTSPVMLFDDLGSLGISI